MIKIQHILIISSILISCIAKQSHAQYAVLEDKVKEIAESAKGTVGIAIKDLNTNDTFILNGNSAFPMQSVFKLPLALAILHKVDQGKLNLNQSVHITKEDLSIPYASPLREKFPEGNIDITLAQLLSYTVSESDNNGCDIVFRLAGGTKSVNKYIHSLGIKGINIAATEKQMGRDWKVQYVNSSTPEAMLQLLESFYRGKILSPSNGAFLWNLLTGTVNAPGRIKGLLPEGTIVGHKPGTSGTSKDGFTATTNDVGIVELPDKKHFAIVIFICNSTGDAQSRAGAIAKISKLIWDSYRF